MGQCNGTPEEPGFQSGIKSISLTNLNDQNLRQSLKKTTSDSLRSTNSHIWGSAFILGCKSDQNLSYLNRYMLLFLFFIKRKDGNIQDQIDDFFRILKKANELNKIENQIKQLEKNYKQKVTAKQRQSFLIEEIFKNKLFSSAIQRFSTISEDSRIFGYVQRPIVDIFKSIKQRNSSLKFRGKQIYCVIQIKSEEFKILNQISQETNQNYFAFSTFVRCYSDQEMAKKYQRDLQKHGQNLRQSSGIQSQTVFFYIFIPKDKVDNDYDFGFYFSQSQKENELGDIILNIRNYFKITNANPQEKTFSIQYNALPKLIHDKRQRSLDVQPRLLRINDLITAKSQQIYSQSALVRVIGQKQLSLSLSQTALKSSTKSDNPILIAQRSNLLETYIQSSQYDKAQKQCDQLLQSNNQAINYKVKKAQINYEKRNYDKVDELLKELEPLKKTLKQKFFQEYVLYEYLSAKRLVAKGATTKAREKLKILRDAMGSKYLQLYEFKGREIDDFIYELEADSMISKKRVKWSQLSDGINVGVTLSH